MSDEQVAPAIEMRGITKRFGEVVANEAVDFEARAGEVHALIGENGAGKSTLMSILSGLYRPDAGTILINGEPVAFRSPADAIAHGIGMVYQHFMLVDSFTVAENMLLGQETGRAVLDLAAAEAEIERIGRQYGLEIDAGAPVWQLSVGEEQRVEILRVLYRGARILVLDEPTAVLTPQEADKLIATLRGMAANGFAIVFISHKLDEVLAVADRVTVLRRGRTVATIDAAGADRAALARLMVGRDLASFVEHPDVEPHAAIEPGPVVLDVQGITARSDKGVEALHEVSLQVRSGEIVGVAGVSGNGQRELSEAITGLRPVDAGRVMLGPLDITNASPKRIAEAGMAHVPEDRIRDGLAAAMDVAENAILREFDAQPISQGPFLVPAAVSRFTETIIDHFDVQPGDQRVRMSTLSGGNQQKLLLGRELAGEPAALVAVHPTRGVDVGATELIHGVIRDQRARGAAILLISEDLDELLALSDRIAVMYKGEIVGTVDAAGADREQVGLLMAGIRPEVTRG